MNLTKALLTILAISVLCGCCPNLDKDKIKSELSSNIKIGDPREMVEQVLKANQLEFSYDEFQQRYPSGIEGGGCEFNKSVIIYIYIDQSGQVSKIETSDSYTFL